MLPLAEVQKAVYDALTVAVAPVPVLDRGHNETFPYYTLGETISGHADTLTEQGVDIEVTVHAWSRQPGMQECEQMMALAKDAIDRRVLPVLGFQWVTAIWDYAQTMRDPDGVTRHGILRFRVLTFQTTT
jgi:hypothetical protein